MKKALILFSLLCICLPALAQQDTLPPKVHHAEPLYIDLIRDLGARKGEKEWNIGGEAEEHPNYRAYCGFIEYEFAPVNRLGMELEIPFDIYDSRVRQPGQGKIPKSRIESIKPAVQYTFLVSPTRQTSLAIGYIHHFNLHSFYSIRQQHDIFKGNAYNPFVVAAKKWGTSIHSLINTGPLWEHASEDRKTYFYYQVNASLYYMIPNTSNFLGVEVNQMYARDESIVVVRPQVKIAISPNLALGLVTGIPLHSKAEGVSGMFRLIYEPPQRK